MADHNVCAACMHAMHLLAILQGMVPTLYTVPQHEWLEGPLWKPTGGSLPVLNQSQDPAEQRL